jgi:hypothetical protein
MVLNWVVVDVDRMAQIVVIYILADPYQTPPREIGCGFVVSTVWVALVVLISFVSREMAWGFVV